MHGSTSCSMARRQTMLRCFSFFIISSSLVLIWMWTVRTRSANTFTAHTSPKRYQHKSNNINNQQSTMTISFTIIGQKFQGTKVPGRFAHGNKSSRKQTCQGAKVLTSTSHLRFYRAILSHDCATLLSNKVADTVTFKSHAATSVVLTKWLLHHFSRFTILLHKYSSKMEKLFHI